MDPELAELHDALDEIGVKLSNLKAPDHWKIEEGVEDPTEEACLKALDFIWEIYEKIEEFPTVIAATKENGVWLSYKRENVSLSMEIYNVDLSAGVIITDDKNKKIVLCKDIVDMELDEALHAYEMES